MNYENYCKVLEQIELHPEQWKQISWHCGGAHCFAGWAEVLGYGTESADREDVARRACHWLEITPDIAANRRAWRVPYTHWLYAGSRTLDDFRRVRAVLGWAHLAASR